MLLPDFSQSPVKVDVKKKAKNKKKAKRSDDEDIDIIDSDQFKDTEREEDAESDGFNIIQSDDEYVPPKKQTIIEIEDSQPTTEVVGLQEDPEDLIFKEEEKTFSLI